MGEYYAVLELQKLHGMGSIKSLEIHNHRETTKNMQHVDPNLTYLNKIIVSTGGPSYCDRWKEILRDREASTGKNITIRRTSVTAISAVTAMSPGAEKALNIDLDRWCEKNREWFEEKFGAENIIAMELHLDEVDDTPTGGRRGAHLHTLIIPLDERDHLCARSFMGTRMQMRDLQTSYGKAMEEFGLVRGERNSKIKHTDRKRWYSTVSGILKEPAPRIQDGETMENYLERLDTTFQDRMAAAQKEVDKWVKKYARSETRQAQIFGEYAYAVNLQHLLEESYGGDMRLVNERLKQYQILEKAVPRKNLDMMLDKMIEKYPPENNISFYRRGKKKKHAKWESLPDESTTTTTSSAPTGNEHIFDDDEYDDKGKYDQSGKGNMVEENTQESEFVFTSATGEELDD